MNSERIRSDSTLQHLARHNWNSWYSMSTHLRSVSQTLRSRAFRCIHYELSRHRETLHATASVASCRDTPPTRIQTGLFMGLHGSCHTRYPWDSMEAARFPHSLSMGLHGSCHVSTRTLHGTPWKLPGFHTHSPWDSEAARLPHTLCPHQFSVTVLHTNVADKNRYYTSIHHVSERTKTVLA